VSKLEILVALGLGSGRGAYSDYLDLVPKEIKYSTHNQKLLYSNIGFLTSQGGTRNQNSGRICWQSEKT